MKELINLLADTNVEFRKRVNDGGNSVVIVMDNESNSETVSFNFKKDGTLKSVVRCAADTTLTGKWL